MITTAKTMEDLIRQAESVQQRLEAGQISNSVARTLLVSITVKMNGFRINMQASALGCTIKNQELFEEQRLKLVA